MKLNMNSVVGLLTNLRWDWFKLYIFPCFLVVLWGGGVR